MRALPTISVLVVLCATFWLQRKLRNIGKLLRHVIHVHCMLNPITIHVNRAYIPVNLPTSGTKNIT